MPIQYERKRKCVRFAILLFKLLSWVRKKNHFKANKQELNFDLIFSMGKLLFLLQFFHSKQRENLKKFQRKRKQNFRSNNLSRWLTYLSILMKAMKIVENVYIAWFVFKIEWKKMSMNCYWSDFILTQCKIHATWGRQQRRIVQRCVAAGTVETVWIDGRINGQWKWIDGRIDAGSWWISCLSCGQRWSGRRYRIATVER